jgi:hypothetical protein
VAPPWPGYDSATPVRSHAACRTVTGTRWTVTWAPGCPQAGRNSGGTAVGARDRHLAADLPRAPVAAGDAGRLAARAAGRGRAAGAQTCQSARCRAQHRATVPSAGPTSAGRCSAARWLLTSETAPGAERESSRGPGRLGPYADGEIFSISCASPGYCSAGGGFFARTGQTQPFVVSEHDGVWGQVMLVPGSRAPDAGSKAYIASVSCGPRRLRGRGRLQRWQACPRVRGHRAERHWGRARAVTGP